MAELADAIDSGSIVSNDMQVRFLLGAPCKTPLLSAKTKRGFYNDIRFLQIAFGNSFVLFR